jgi:eukaryotic-like serine/threonine-protein kinase
MVGIVTRQPPRRSVVLTPRSGIGANVIRRDATEQDPDPVAARGSRPNEFTPRPQTEHGEELLYLEPGERIDQYEIIRELGRGGMGQVFMARDTRLGRVVAIKFLTRTAETFVKRFLVEAQTTAQCTHENIVVLYDTNAYRNHPYLVLEYLEGDTLAKIIADRSLSASRTIEIMVPVVRALRRAHQFGIVHRDLKPENILITTTGTVKVLDFGVAKLFNEDDDPALVRSEVAHELYETLSTGSRMVGTLPFMSPEQFGIDVVDERTDLWAVGVMMFRMLAAQHPIPDATSASLMFSARELDVPHRSLADVAPGVPPALARIVNRCLRKRKSERYASADELLDELELLLPARHGRRLEADECPYPGLLAFEEADADRFFGRSHEIARAVASLRDNTVLALVGPSGAGKSSFVRAGLIPELKASGATWETFILRPGRAPLASITGLIEACTGRPVVDDYTAILHDEPGYLGHLLREHARAKQLRILVLVDQFEELYTLAPDAERDTFIAVLRGIADDTTSPLRLVISLRSDFLHRVAGHAAFADAVTRGLLLLGPPDLAALRDAMTGPAAKADYRFESDAMIDEVMAELEHSAAPFPLLQFCMSTLWAQRDRGRRMLSHESFAAMGGVAGALATHADHTIATLSAGAQRIARTLFQRLVTSEGTRAIVDARELEGCGDDLGAVRRVLAALVEARLLVHHQDTGTVEIIHEALVGEWPTLRRWMEEGREDTVFLEQLRAAAGQWSSKHRSAGLLWRGAAAKDAARFLERQGDTGLAAREREFLHAVILADRRAARRKTVVVGSIITVLVLLVAGSAVALFAIHDAENEARHAENEAQKTAALAKTEAARAHEAERTVTEQLAVVQKAERDRQAAASAAEASAVEAAQRRAEAEMSREQLEQAFHKLKAALRRAEVARDAAEASRKAETQAKQRLQEALAREQERARKLEVQRGKIVDKL